MTRATVAVVAILATLAGVAVGWATINTPACPEEDTCSVDYRHGGCWINPDPDAPTDAPGWVQVTR